MRLKSSVQTQKSIQFSHIGIRTIRVDDGEVQIIRGDFIDDFLCRSDQRLNDLSTRSAFGKDNH